MGDKTVNIPADSDEELKTGATSSEEKQSDTKPKTLTARSNLDARECLGLTGNQAIATCAEAFGLEAN